MNSVQFYTCSRCKASLPAILKPLHKEKCKKKIVYNTNHKIYESDIEEESKKIVQRMREQILQSTQNNSNSYRISSNNDNFVFESSSNISIHNPLNNYISSNALGITTSNHIMISPQNENVPTFSRNAFTIDAIDNNISLNIICNLENKYVVNFDAAKKRIIKEESEDLKPLIEFCQEITEKIGVHFQHIGNMLLNVVNCEDTSEDVESCKEIQDKIKRVYREIVLYVREDLEKIKELIFLFYNEGENFEVNVDEIFTILERAYSSFSDLRNLLEKNKLGFHDVELLLPLIGISPVSQQIINFLPERVLNKDEINSDEMKKCVICQENFEEKDIIISLPCMHSYHSKCIRKWFKTNNTCPICKLIITENI